MRSLIANNFMYSVIAAILLVIVGGFLAFKADSKWGYGVILGGAALFVYCLKVQGLI